MAAKRKKPSTPITTSSVAEAMNDLNVELHRNFPATYTPRQRFADYNALFRGSAVGRRVLNDLLERSGFYESPVRNGDDDSDRLVFLRIGAANQMRGLLASLLIEPPPDPPHKAETENPKETTDAR